jgi:hypothetical protein
MTGENRDCRVEDPFAESLVGLSANTRAHVTTKKPTIRPRRQIKMGSHAVRNRSRPVRWTAMVTIRRTPRASGTSGPIANSVQKVRWISMVAKRRRNAT